MENRLIDNPTVRKLIDQKLLRYVEETIIPEYEKNDPAHGVSHAKYVVRRAIEFGAQKGANINMCFVAAAYHDAMHHVDRNRHEELSAEYFMKDSFMEEYFSLMERVIIKEAIEDHRSHLEGEPRSIYGKIVSSADRTTDTKTAIARTDKFLKKHYPEYSLSKRIETSYEYIREKYGPSGCAKTYFEDEDFNHMKKELIEILKDREHYGIVYMQASGYLRKGLS